MALTHKHVMDRQDIIDKLNDIKDALRRKGVAHLALYGSMARGEAGPDSDIDLLITLSRPSPSLIALSRLKRELSTELGRAVDITTTPLHNPHLRRRAGVVRTAMAGHHRNAPFSRPWI